MVAEGPVHHMTEDRLQPCQPGRLVLAAELLQATLDREKGLLHDVSRIDPRGHPPPEPVLGQGMEIAAPGLQELTQGMQISALGLAEQLLKLRGVAHQPSLLHLEPSAAHSGRALAEKSSAATPEWTGFPMAMLAICRYFPLKNGPRQPNFDYCKKQARRQRSAARGRGFPTGILLDNEAVRCSTGRG